MQEAAAKAPDGSHIWLEPVQYGVVELEYSKTLYWHGQTMTADQIQANQGNVWLEGTGAGYFNISNATGGGLYEMGMSNRPVSSYMVSLHNVTNFTLNNVYTHPTNPTTNSLRQNKPLLVTSGDCSGLKMLYCDAHSTPLVRAQRHRSRLADRPPLRPIRRHTVNPTHRHSGRL